MPMYLPSGHTMYYSRWVHHSLKAGTIEPCRYVHMGKTWDEAVSSRFHPSSTMPLANRRRETWYRAVSSPAAGYIHIHTTHTHTHRDKHVPHPECRDSEASLCPDEKGNRSSTAPRFLSLHPANPRAWLFFPPQTRTTQTVNFPHPFSSETEPGLIHASHRIDTRLGELIRDFPGFSRGRDWVGLGERSGCDAKSTQEADKLNEETGHPHSLHIPAAYPAPVSSFKLNLVVLVAHTDETALSPLFMSLVLFSAPSLPPSYDVSNTEGEYDVALKQINLSFFASFSFSPPAIAPIDDF